MRDLKDGESGQVQGLARTPYILKNVGGVSFQDAEGRVVEPLPGKGRHKGPGAPSFWLARARYGTGGRRALAPLALPPVGTPRPPPDLRLLDLTCSTCWTTRPPELGPAGSPG